MEHLTAHLHRPRTTRSPLSLWGDGGSVPFEPFFSLLEIKMGAGLQKDLRVSRVGPGWSLNAFFFLLIGVIVTNERSSSHLCFIDIGAKVSTPAHHPLMELAEPREKIPRYNKESKKGSKPLKQKALKNAMTWDRASYLVDSPFPPPRALAFRVDTQEFHYEDMTQSLKSMMCPTDRRIPSILTKMLLGEKNLLTQEHLNLFFLCPTSAYVKASAHHSVKGNATQGSKKKAGASLERLGKSRERVVAILASLLRRSSTTLLKNLPSRVGLSHAFTKEFSPSQRKSDKADSKLSFIPRHNLYPCASYSPGVRSQKYSHPCPLTSIPRASYPFSLNDGRAANPTRKTHIGLRDNQARTDDFHHVKVTLYH
uniref:Uncharacterized protein n=1 Tax=Solanum lycopersicum TaxID=4081 RepID=A0A3Q7GS21_SOLLC